MSHSTLITSSTRLPSLRTAIIPSLLNCTASSSTASSSTSTSSSASRSLHTTSTTLESKRKIVARQKKAKNLSLRSERSRQDVQGLVDPVMGDLRPETKMGGFFARQQQQQGGRNAGSAADVDAEVGAKYERSLLKKVVLDRTSIWFSQPPQYPSQYTSSNSQFPSPTHPSTYSQSLSSTADQDLVFKRLPESVLSNLPAALAVKQGKTPTPSESRAYEEQLTVEAKMNEQVMRVLDLRNADAKGIKKENVRRIVEVFGGDLNNIGADAASSSSAADVASDTAAGVLPRMNTGHPTVTSAILTLRIHLLSTHLSQNPRDVHNKKRLRELVHQRAKVLSYYKRRVGRRGGEGEGAYLGLLEKLGLDRRGVEGELIVR